MIWLIIRSVRIGDNGLMESQNLPPLFYETELSIRGLSLNATIRVPDSPVGVVIFSHGSGSSRRSPRNTTVAEILTDSKVATVLLDLLTPEEDQYLNNRFNIPLLTNRLQAAVEWTKHQAGLQRLPIALFGASTGAASALKVAARLGGQISAVVSRGGRPDLANEALPLVAAPTLLIVGELDPDVEELNRAALQRLRCERELVIVPGATHLFEETGTLDQVATLAAKWFLDHFRAASRPQTAAAP